MAQNLVDLDFTADTLAAIDAALAALETGLAGLLALTPDQRQGLTKMGDKSEAFCRKADAVFGENLAILPANFDLAAYRRDLATLDALRPRLARLSKLSQRGDDTQMAVGSDLMTKSAGGLRGAQGHRQGAGRGRPSQDARQPLCPRPAHSLDTDHADRADGELIAGRLRQQVAKSPASRGFLLSRLHRLVLLCPADIHRRQT